jgi:TonB family protein
MTRIAVVLLLLYAASANGALEKVLTLPRLFVCGRDVYWFEHPPVMTTPVPWFSFPSNVLYFARPDYPYEARLKLMEGSMLIDLRIKPDGTVERIEIVQPPRYPLLALAAKEGFRHWRFSRGTPERVQIPVTFSLHCTE